MTKWHPTEVIKRPDGHWSVAFDDSPPGTDGHRVRFQRFAADRTIRIAVAVVYHNGKPHPWPCPNQLARRLGKRAAVLLR